MKANLKIMDIDSLYEYKRKLEDRVNVLKDRTFEIKMEILSINEMVSEKIKTDIG